MTVLLRDVINIPERVSSDDYVLRLTDSTGDDALISATLDAYVLTDSLTENFRAALDLVADAITKNTSRGAFLTGSFGSGKSHFMAVLYALLGDHAALRTSTFHALTGHYDGTLRGKKLLRLTYHLLGARSLEEAVLGGYLAQIRRLHPEAPLPAVHHADTLLADAEGWRARMGDEDFLAGLTGGDGGNDSDRWGDLLTSGWNLERYQRALAAAPDDPERRALVSALVDSYFTSFTETAGYVDLDRGLTAVSEHARSLGYDGVVLFLDELVLWLAFSVRDNEFFGRESQKITKLVESAGRPRSIPLISFISRQMDLRKWFADAGASGAEQDALDRAFQYQQGRFREIALGDDNLAEVVHARLLRPKNDAAQAVLDDAFARLTRRPEVWDVLRESTTTDQRRSGASADEFRLTYPFSPVLVSTLRQLSTVMQRERTALKVMQRMLVDRRDTLTVDDLIAVGEAFEYLIEGSEPIDRHAKTMFDAARELYNGRLLPTLMETHGVTAEQLTADPASVPVGFRGHQRIAKTLLLSAIAPRVPALRDITAARLAALNHGSIRSPIAGGEARAVLGVVRSWKRTAPEISVDDSANPPIRVTLAEVDYRSVLARIAPEDNTGRRRATVRRLIHRALGVEDAPEAMGGVVTCTLTWRGSRRDIDIVFGNVRDVTVLPDGVFDARPGTWRVVIDYPFDDAGYTLSDDVERLDTLVAGEERRTLVWLPRFFTDAAMDDLATLVKLDWLLAGAGDRWTENTDHLSVNDRAQARGILENLRQNTLVAVENLLKQAYGIETADPKSIAADAVRFDIVTSLSRDVRLDLPVVATLGQAFVALVSNALSATLPQHPLFEPADSEVTTKQLQTVLDYVEKADSHRDGRVPTLPGADRVAVRRVAGPLRVGRATEDHFLFDRTSFDYWAGQLDRAAETVQPVTVRALREHIDGISPAWGLPAAARDLVISAWALLSKRGWFDAGRAVPAPKLGALRDNTELRAETLPDADRWELARSNATKLFGLTTVRTHLTGANVAAFAGEVRQRATTVAAALSPLIRALESAHGRLDAVVGPDDRLTAAAALHATATTLARSADNVAVIDTLAALALPVAVETAASVAAEAEVDTRTLRNTKWQLVELLIGSAREGGESADVANQIWHSMQLAVSVPGRSLTDAMVAADTRLTAWLVDRNRSTPAEVPPPAPRPSPIPTEPRTPGPASDSTPDPEQSRTLTRPADVAALTAEITAALAAGGSVHLRWWRA